MSDQLAFLPERVFTAAAMPGAGYRVEFFQSGTTTPVTVYTTSALSIAHPSPLVCDANGVFPAVFSAGGAIKAVVTKPDASSFYTLDPVFRVPTSGAGASEITFAPTPSLPFTNVQDAVEAAAASAASGFTPFGLGVTGTNALIANLDATNTASGSYRFDNTTTGTFPTGVTAANTGTVQIDRENAGDAVMRLQSGAADRWFMRRMASSTWGAWQELVSIPQGTVQGDIPIRGSASFERLAVGAAGTVLVGGTQPSWGGFLIVADEKTAGTNGGTSLGGNYFVRTLNTTRVNTITGASLASNQITLPAGTYRINASAPAYRGDLHSARLQNITDATTTVQGTSEYTEVGGAAVQTRAFIVGTFTIAATKVFELQMRVGTGVATNGWGLANGWNTEVYSIVEIQKIG